MKLTGNTILVTGGTSGIGLAMALEFHKRGNKVIIAGRRQQLIDTIIAENPGVDGFVLDIADSKSITETSKLIIEKYPDLNVVFNNAGIMPPEFDEKGAYNDAVAVEVVTTNLLGTARVSNAFWEQLKSQKESYLINNTSVLGFIPLAVYPIYSSTKAALHSYTMSQRFLLNGSSVKVIEIAPPWVDSGLVESNGDPRAMPLDAFVSQTFEKLEGDNIEAFIDGIASLRDNPGANEHEFVNGFNIAMTSPPA